MATKRGRIRIFVEKLDIHNKFEELSYSYFDDEFISNINESSYPGGTLDFELTHGGLCAFYGSICDILRGCSVGSVVEIIADAHVKYYKSFNGEITEHEAQCWLENEKYRELTESQVLTLFEEDTVI